MDENLNSYRIRFKALVATIRTEFGRSTQIKIKTTSGNHMKKVSLSRALHTTWVPLHQDLFFHINCRTERAQTHNQIHDAMQTILDIQQTSATTQTKSTPPAFTVSHNKKHYKRLKKPSKKIKLRNPKSQKQQK